ncbi:MAG: DoxX protein [Chitinophaga sp.]|uniref:DoxX protein n=1 Tax=Chitinophaga sp. TaxID=1869181 RepID=UPI0025B99637|nr:DoxX protein [Chitinophaga sp.]MBV8253685.1 DoxX protein [Chitinophaga sp.]
MISNTAITSLLLRLALAGGFLSAVASRTGLWGKQSSGWDAFLKYTAQVNSFMPSTAIPAIAISSTILETTLACLLLLGYKTSLVAVAAGTLTLFFACAMAWSFGWKEVLDYSVLAFSAGSFLLASVPTSRWSLDYLLQR